MEIHAKVCILQEDSMDALKLMGMIPQPVVSKDVMDSPYEGELLNGSHDFEPTDDDLS